MSAFEPAGAPPPPERPPEPEPEQPPSWEPQPPARPDTVRPLRAAFRQWRRTRPFWGGLLITAGGAQILITEWAPFRVVLHIGLQGLAGYLLPAVMVLCGLLLWFTPAQRTFYGVLSVMLSLGTWVTSNLGGFFIGMLLGLVGGSLAFGWSSQARREPVRQRNGRSKKKADPAGA